jgi:hypothetical protein
MTLESQNRIGNDSVNRFPRQLIHNQQSKYCWDITMVPVFSFGSAARLYNEDPRLAEEELRQSLEIAVEDD